MRAFVTIYVRTIGHNYMPIRFIRLKQENSHHGDHCYGMADCGCNGCTLPSLEVR